MRSKPAVTVCLITGGLPLVAYPFVAPADLMSLAAKEDGRAPSVLAAVSRATQLASLLYPVVYVAASVVAVRRLRRDRPATAVSAVPLVYLLLLSGLFAAWVAADTHR